MRNLLAVIVLGAALLFSASAGFAQTSSRSPSVTSNMGEFLVDNQPTPFLLDLQPQ